MAKPYLHASELAGALSEKRERRALSYEKLGRLAAVDPAHAYRICKGEFRTLGPSVLRICHVLGVQPKCAGAIGHLHFDDATHEMLSAEVLAAWDRTEEGAKLLTRVLRALQKSR